MLKELPARIVLSTFTVIPLFFAYSNAQSKCIHWFLHRCVFVRISFSFITNYLICKKLRNRSQRLWKKFLKNKKQRWAEEAFSIANLFNPFYLSFKSYAVNLRSWIIIDAIIEFVLKGTGYAMWCLIIGGLKITSSTIRRIKSRSDVREGPLLDWFCKLCGGYTIFPSLSQLMTDRFQCY